MGRETEAEQQGVDVEFERLSRLPGARKLTRKIWHWMSQKKSVSMDGWMDREIGGRTEGRKDKRAK